MGFIFRIIRRILLSFLLLSVGTVLLYRWVNPPVTPLMIIRCTQKLAQREPPVLHKTWKPLSEISPNMSQAVMASEDQLFPDHNGFDFKAIEKAMKNNTSVKKKKKIRGGSTISQQTAKNVFLWPGRSWVRKGFEAYFTLLIEAMWSKERIMEVYLNVIEMGDGVYGAEAASRLYFKKPAEKLSQGQAALIAAILPNPLKWSPLRPTSYLVSRQVWILRNMNNLGEVELE